MPSFSHEGGGKCLGTNEKAEGDISMLLAFPHSQKTKKYLDGMKPFRPTQLPIVEDEVASALATLVGPPKALMTSAAVVSIAHYRSRKRKKSTMYQDVGRRLYKVRMALDMSRKEFAKFLDISEGNLCDFEKGNRRISLNTALRLTHHTNVTLDWLYTGAFNGSLNFYIHQMRKTA